MTSAQQALLPAQEKGRLKRDLRKHLKGDVVLRLYTQRPSPIAIPGRDCRYCPQVQQLLEELARLSPRLEVEIFDFYGDRNAAREEGIDRIPATVIQSGSNGRARYFGLPMGYQLPVLIDTIKAVSRGATRLSVNSRKQLRRLTKPVHLQIFATPGSETAAGMALLGHAMAVESPQVITDVVEIEEFPEMARRYGIRQVPVAVINEISTFSGMVGESELLERVTHAGTDGSFGSDG